jgi:hypothetical protein
MVIISLYSSDLFILITQMHCVYCVVQTESLNIIHLMLVLVFKGLMLQ